MNGRLFLPYILIYHCNVLVRYTLEVFRLIAICSYEEWLEQFVTPFAENCHGVLKKSGLLALHIFDTYRYAFIEPFMEILMQVGFGHETQYIYSKLKNTLRPQYVHIFRKVR